MDISGKVLSKIKKGVSKGMGLAFAIVPKSKRMGAKAEVLRSLIPLVGAGEVKRRMILGLTEEFGEKHKKNPQVTEDELVGQYVNEPKVLALLKDLDIGEDYLRGMARETLRLGEAR